MVQAVSQGMSFPEFLAWKPETGRFELYDGVVVEMQPTGSHEQVVGVLNQKLNVLIEQEDLHCFIPDTAMVKPLGSESGYKPDLLMEDVKQWLTDHKAELQDPYQISELGILGSICARGSDRLEHDNLIDRISSLLCGSDPGIDFSSQLGSLISKVIIRPSALDRSMSAWQAA